MREVRDSGANWLGRIPSDWSVTPLGVHFTERKEQVSDVDFPALSVTKSGVVPQLESAAKTDNNDARKLIRAGDFVINTRSDRKGSSGVSPFDGSSSAVYTVLTPGSSVHGPFIHHLLRSAAFQEEFYRWGNGIVADLWSTRYAAMRRIPLPVPPLEEQREIAAFLDEQTSRIDTLIAKQTQLIDTLRERRTTVVERAVLSGMERDGPRKSAPVQWLPDAPTSWKWLQLGFVADTLAGYAFPSERFELDESHTRLLRGVNVKPGEVDWTDTVYWDESARPIPPEFHLLDKDVVIGMDRPFVGSGSRVASLSMQDLPALLLQRVLRLRADRGALQEYLGAVLTTRAFAAYVEPLFTGVSVPHMSEWQVRKFVIPLPPIREQRAIVDRLRAQTPQIDALITKAQQHIALAKERRAALITAAVTGQIDVRTASPAEMVVA